MSDALQKQLNDPTICQVCGIKIESVAAERERCRQAIIDCQGLTYDEKNIAIMAINK